MHAQGYHGRVSAPSWFDLEGSYAPYRDRISPAKNELLPDTTSAFTVTLQTRRLRCVVPARRAVSAFYAVLVHRRAGFS